MIRYKLERNNKTKYFSLLLLICGLVLFMLSSNLGITPFIVQIVSIALIVLAIQVLQRYVLSEFVYVIDDSEVGESILSIVRIQGKKKVTVCSIEFENCVFAGECSKFDKKLSNSFDYRQNLFDTQNFGIVYNNANDNIMIKLEPDQAFIDEILKRICDFTEI